MYWYCDHVIDRYALRNAIRSGAYPALLLWGMPDAPGAWG